MCHEVVSDDVRSKMITRNSVVKEGQEILCIGARNIENNLTNGKTYVALNGLEAGIFPDRPYVTVIGDNGTEYSCHASRFATR